MYRWTTDSQQIDLSPYCNYALQFIVLLALDSFRYLYTKFWMLTVGAFYERILHSCTHAKAKYMDQHDDDSLFLKFTLISQIHIHEQNSWKPTTVPFTGQLIRQCVGTSTCIGAWEYTQPQEGRDFWSQKFFERLKTTVEPNISYNLMEVKWKYMYVYTYCLACSMGGIIFTWSVYYIFNYMLNALGILWLSQLPPPLSC